MIYITFYIYLYIYYIYYLLSCRPASRPQAANMSSPRDALTVAVTPEAFRR